MYKLAYYRKQTKDQWARDDPGFIALQVGIRIMIMCSECDVMKNTNVRNYPAAAVTSFSFFRFSSLPSQVLHAPALDCAPSVGINPSTTILQIFFIIVTTVLWSVVFQYG